MSSRPIRLQNIRAGRATRLAAIPEWQYTVDGVTFDMVTARPNGSEDAGIEARTSSGDQSSTGRQSSDWRRTTSDGG